MGPTTPLKIAVAPTPVIGVDATAVNAGAALGELDADIRLIHHSSSFKKALTSDGPRRWLPMAREYQPWMAESKVTYSSTTVIVQCSALSLIVPPGALA
jgi:hypothetical protein